MSNRQELEKPQRGFMPRPKHSGGKWDFNDYGGTFLTLEADGMAIAQIERLEKRGEGTEEAYANARLLAASPELLELAQALLGFDIATPKDYATKGMEAFSPMVRHFIGLQNQARAAIAKVAAA